MPDARTCYVAPCDRGRNGHSATISAREKIIYVGLNLYASIEADALEKATKSFGGIAADYRDPVSEKLVGIDIDLSDKEQFEKFLKQLVEDEPRRNRLRDALSAVTDDQITAGKDNLRGVLGRLAQFFNDIETDNLRVRRMVLSSHASRTSFFDEFQSKYTADDLLGIASVFPKAARSIRHLMVSGCFTGYTDLFKTYREIFPNLTTIWAYAKRSPSSDPTKGSHSVAHILEWERQTRPRSAKRLYRKRVGASAENIAVWSEKFGVEPRIRPLKVIDKEVDAHRPVYKAAFAGEVYTSEELLIYYTLLNEQCSHPQQKDKNKSEIKKEIKRTLLLRFYPAARQHFMQYYRKELETGFTKLMRPLPAFDRLSRKAALEAIEDFENAVVDHSLNHLSAANQALKTLKDHLLNLDMPESWAEAGQR
jgi:hypothetical protein